MNKYPTTKEILFDFGRALLDIEFGIIPTFWHLFVRPGYVIRDYFESKKYFHPLKYLAVVLIIYGLIHNVKLVQITTSSGEASATLVEMIIEYFPYIWTISFSSVVSLFYRKSKMNTGEHLVINCYLFAQALITITFIDLIWDSDILIIPIILLFTTRGYYSYVNLPIKQQLIRIIPAMIIALIVSMVISLAIVLAIHTIQQKSLELELGIG